MRASMGRGCGPSYTATLARASGFRLWESGPVDSGELRWLQPLALVFLVAADLVTATRWGRDVLLALEVPIDPIVVDPHPAVVLEGLEVASDAVSVGHEEPSLLV